MNPSLHDERKIISWILILFGILVIVVGFFTLVKAEEPSTYTVKTGDSLSSIAKTIYGDELKWRQIWDQNKQIKDPNLIYPGQLLSLDPTIKIVTPSKPLKVESSWVSSSVFEEKLLNIMFKEVGIKKEPKLDYIIRTRMALENITFYNRSSIYYRSRQIINSNLHSDFVALEIYELASVLTSLYKVDKELACLCAAMAWKETGFHNRRGRAGEVGFYQVLPSTIKNLYTKDTSEKVIRQIEEDPKFATTFNIWYVAALKREHKTLENALYHYNGHPDYAGSVISKSNYLRRIMK